MEPTHYCRHVCGYVTGPQPQLPHPPAGTTDDDLRDSDQVAYDALGQICRFLQDRQVDDAATLRYIDLELGMWRGELGALNTAGRWTGLGATERETAAHDALGRIERVFWDHRARSITDATALEWVRERMRAYQDRLAQLGEARPECR